MMTFRRYAWLTIGLSFAALWAACGDSGGGSQQPGNLVVWTEHVANKVQPTTIPGAATEINLAGPRRSYEAAQIVVFAEEGVLSGVNMTAGDLTDGTGNTIEASNITLYRQAFIDFEGVSENEPGNQPVPDNSPTNDSRIPDPLIPFRDPYTQAEVGAPFPVRAGENQPVWVDIHVPENTVAGTYTGTITVTATDQPDVVVPVTLEVWDLVLPDMRTVTTHFSSHWEAAIHYHRDIYACSGGNCWIDWNLQARLIVKRYEELAHAHRIDTGQYFVPSPDAPDTCAVPTDWSAYDQAVAPYMDGTHFSDGVPVTYLRTPFSPGVTWGLEGSCTQAEYEALAAAWAQHLKTQGWFSRALVYAYDEPPDAVLPDIAQHAQWMQNGDPDWKSRILVTKSATPASTAVLNPALGIYCVCLRCYDHWYDNRDYFGRAEWPDLFSQGIQLWFYESNAQSDPYPTFATNTLLGVEPRVVMWGSWYENATGFLLWDTVAWTIDDPWGPNVDWGKSGDGVLIYPGHHDGLDEPEGSPSDVTIDGPIPSYRLKMVRAGLQDWALFNLADQHGLTDYARQEVARVYSQFGGCEWSGCPPPVNGEFFWLSDEQLMDEVRRNIALAIVGNM